MWKCGLESQGVRHVKAGGPGRESHPGRARKCKCPKAGASLCDLRPPKASVPGA